MVDGGLGGGGETAIDVRFGSGDELLSAYWGYLTGGGLIIADPGYEVGRPLSMRVTIDSSASQYRLRGTVVKREPDSAKAIIAFRSGEAHDMLLSEALADSENVAPRRYARFGVDSHILASWHEHECDARIVNVSREGCCLELSKDQRADMAIDAEVAVRYGDVHALGTVVWIRNIERGLHMSPDEAGPLLQALLPDLC
jgi:hypothetical protein